METQITNAMKAIREGWSEEERRARMLLADVIQLRLQDLLVPVEAVSVGGTPKLRPAELSIK